MVYIEGRDLGVFCLGIVSRSTVRIWGYGGLLAVQLGLAPAAPKPCWGTLGPHLFTTVALISQQRCWHQARMAHICSPLQPQVCNCSLWYHLPCSPLSHGVLPFSLCYSHIYPLVYPWGLLRWQGSTLKPADPLRSWETAGPPAAPPFVSSPWQNGFSPKMGPLLRMTPVILQ